MEFKISLKSVKMNFKHKGKITKRIRSQKDKWNNNTKNWSKNYKYKSKTPKNNWMIPKNNLGPIENKFQP